MKKIIFYSLPGFGHINPTLTVASELTKQGYSVFYYSTEEFKKYIVAAGVTFKSYHVVISDEHRASSRNPAKFLRALVDVIEERGPILLQEAMDEKPDLIVHDGVAFWGKFIAHKLHIPAVSFITTQVLGKHMFFRPQKIVLTSLHKIFFSKHNIFSTIKKYKRFAKQFDIQPDLFDVVMNKEPLNIVTTSSYFHPKSTIFDKTFKFVGPVLAERYHSTHLGPQLSPHKKIIYFSLGTVLNDELKFFQMCIDAFAKSNYQVVISLGQKFTKKDFPSLPKNIIIEDYVDQLDLLQKVDLFITHGGMNSVNEGLYYGIPLLLVPDTEEQLTNAQQVQKLGAGICLNKKKLTHDRLVTSVEKIFTNTNYKRNAEKIGKTLKDAGGAKQAAKEIIDYLAQHNYSAYPGGARTSFI